MIYRVTFEPGGVAIEAPAGEILLDVARAAGVLIPAPCGGQGRCGKCRVRIVQGTAGPLTPEERRHLSPAEESAGWRLACQARVESELEVFVPPSAAQIVVAKPLEDELLAGVPLDPAVRQRTVRLSPPTLQDQRADWRRLREALAPDCPVETATLSALHALPTVLRAQNFEVTAIIREKQVLAVSVPGQARPLLGAAVDIGTTTVVAYLVDLTTGEHVASGMARNPQAQHGADVISRTQYAISEPGALERLQEEAVGIVNSVIRQALAQVGAAPEDVYEIVVVGNTCMHHLFLGLDPQHLARAPYIPIASDLIEVAPEELGVDINPHGAVVCLPVIAGYVGADTVGVILATRLTESSQPVLAIDIGTNGEVVLWSGERLLCASCAAGPAFEGAQIAYGMHAAPGAIAAAALDDGDLRIETISDAEPIGICGSGLFDIMAACLEAGLVDPMGRMIGPEASQALAPALAARLEGEGNTRRLLVAKNKEGTDGVYFTQKDVRELQLAKGAVRAAVELLLQECGLHIEEVSAILLAGAFGNYIRPASALRMGLLPPVEPSRLRGVGNAAGAGAMLALINRQKRWQACEIARQAEHIELADRPDFQQAFMEAMLFL